MFTGIVQCLGEVVSAAQTGSDRRFRIRPGIALSELQAGESIAVNGVCLTVERFGPDWFEVFASAETLSRTNLDVIKPSARVNLERALAVGERLGGHIVNGHVDCRAQVESVRAAGDSTVYRLRHPQQWSRYVVSKGCVALDGVSLTVNDCGPGYLEVNIIPATRGATTISLWRAGSEINMEVDIVAKYVENMVLHRREDPASGEPGERRGLSYDFLREHGF
jgi:riboflavin synthase